MSLNDNSQPARTQPVLPADPHEEMIHQQIEQIERRKEDEKEEV